MFTLKNKNLQAGIVLALVWLGVFIASYAQNQLAGMSVQFMEHYGFTSEQYASIYSASQFIGIFFAFAAGILSDKIGTRNIVLIAAGMVLVATVARIFAFSFEAQYLSNMFCGFTGMFLAVNRAKILGGWFPPATIALAVGIATTTTPVANTLGVGLTSLMPSIEFAFTVTAVVSAVFFVGWFLFGKERSARDRGCRGRLEGRGRRQSSQEPDRDRQDPLDLGTVRRSVLPHGRAGAAHGLHERLARQRTGP